MPKIKVGIPVTRKWCDITYTWILKREGVEYTLERLKAGKRDVGDSPFRRGSLKDMRWEYNRQQMIVDNPWFGGFDAVI